MAPRHAGQDRTEGFFPSLYPWHKTSSIIPASRSRNRKGTVFVYTKGRKGKGRHLLTISIYSSSSVLFNTFLRNTANSCKNSWRSEEQKREDATAEHAEIILQTLMGSQLLQAPPALTGNLKNQKAQYKSSILHYLEGCNTPPTVPPHSGRACFLLLRTRKVQNHLKPITQEEHWLKAKRPVKKGDRRLRSVISMESISPAFQYKATLTQKFC